MCEQLFSASKISQEFLAPGLCSTMGGFLCLKKSEKLRVPFHRRQGNPSFYSSSCALQKNEEKIYKAKFLWSRKVEKVAIYVHI